MNDDDVESIEMYGTIHSAYVFFLRGTLTQKAEAVLVTFLSFSGLGHLLKGLF